MRHLAIIVFAVVAGCPAIAAGQTSTATLSVGFTGIAKLSLSTASLSFPDADPDLIPSVPSNPPTITITAKGRATQNASITLTVLASDDLRSGVSTIPAGMLTWNATGSGFVDGTLSATVPQTVGSWVGSGVRDGTQSFFFRNLWTHPTGTYSVTLVYTLTAA